MLGQSEPHALRERSGESLHRTARHVVDFAALDAHGVMMVRDRAEQVGVFAVLARRAGRSADAFERFERSIDRRKPDGRATAGQRVVQRLRRDVSAHARELRDDRAPLTRHAATLARQLAFDRSELRVAGDGRTSWRTRHGAIRAARRRASRT